MQGVQTQLYSCYKNPHLVKLIAEQIHELSHKFAIKTFRKYVALTLTLPAVTEQYSYKLHPNEIQFVIVLSKGYPCIAPRLHVKTCIISPGFDDCRNLIYEVMGQEEWTHTVRLKDLEAKTLKFLEKLDQNNTNVYHISRLGEFCMNTVYPVELIKELRGTEIYFVFQYDHQNCLKMYVADISSTHLTLFLTKQQPSIEKGGVKIPNEKDITSCMIVFVAELGTISEILANRHGFNEIEIKFTSKKPHNMQLGNLIITRKLKVRKGPNFLRKLIQNLNNYNVLEIKFEPYPNPDTQIEIQKQQKIFLKQVADAQKELDHKFNKESIEKLHNAYQRVVEFYSTNNLPYYAIFVEKITILLQRTDVKLIMETTKETNEEVKI